MFICQITGKVSQPGEKSQKLIVEKRKVTYNNFDREKEEEWQSFGWEIVTELTVSEEGLAVWQKSHPEEATHTLLNGQG